MKNNSSAFITVLQVRANINADQQLSMAIQAVNTADF